VGQRPSRIRLNSPSLPRTYLALVKRSAGPSGGSLLHLIRDDSEASLCGIPRSSLGQGGAFDHEVCGECIEWLPKRMEFSEAHHAVDPPARP
jgi:hypothetical protein